MPPLQLSSLLMLFSLCSGCGLLTPLSARDGEVREPTDQEIASAVRDIELSIPEPAIPAQVLTVVEASGKSPDETGTHDFQADIQRAITRLAQAGGGTLHFTHPLGSSAWIKPVVVYRIRGPIELCSNLRLLIDPAVKLFFEYDPPSYTRKGEGVLTRYEGTTVYSYSPLLRAFNCRDIVIEANAGSGAMPEIDGDGQKWVIRRKVAEIVTGAALPQTNSINSGKLSPDSSALTGIRESNELALPLGQRRSPLGGKFFHTRPDLMQFLLCKNVRVQGIKLSDSPFWVVHPIFSENLVFRELLFDCQNVNNDGVDPESCRNVLIERIIFNNHDDNVALKAGRNREGREGLEIRGTELEGIPSPFIKDGRLGGACERVIIRDNLFKGHYAICIGSEMSGGVRDVYALDNRSVQDVNMGVFIKSSRMRGGIVENIVVRGLDLNHVKGETIAIIPNYDGLAEGKFPPVFRNIYISDVKVRSSNKGIKIFGWPDSPATNIVIRNVTATLRSTKPEDAFAAGSATGITLEKVLMNGVKLDGHYDKTGTGPTPAHD